MAGKRLKAEAGVKVRAVSKAEEELYIYAAGEEGM
jgi:hypothetical protein